MARSRAEMLAQLAAEPLVQAVVIGGGINGISAFRELSLQGVRVLLVERGDFCGACSSAPSRMIHGGLRYLENGELSLVREALRERDALLHNAPHLVHPLPTTVPIRRVFSGLLNAASKALGFAGRPAERGALAVKLGLSFYDFLARRHSDLPGHSFRNRRQTLERWPGLMPSLAYSATYYDAWISHPERLGIELIEDGLAANDAALALNYAEVSRTAGGGLAILDKLSGAMMQVETSLVINATGAWLDKTNSGLFDSRETPPRLVGGTKGSHLIIDHPELLKALDGHMIYFENLDGRVCILFPYLGKVLLGSTDIRVDDPSDARCEDEEVAYMLRSLSHVFPGIAVGPESILYRFSGVRPLPHSTERFTGRVSRDHVVRNLGGTPPVLCMIGGKWTTFRAFGAQCADAALALLGVERRTDSRCRPIGGGDAFPLGAEGQAAFAESLRQRFDISAERVAHAVAHYGSGAAKVLQFCADAGADAALAEGCSYSEAELRYLIRSEYVCELSDLLQRRTSLAITGEISSSIVSRAAALLAEELGWSSTETAAAELRFRDLLARRHGVTADLLSQRDKEGARQCA